MIICGDALAELRKLPEASVHCCVTSPPYWGLRDYGVERQLGLERTPEGYVADMVDVFTQVRRVLRDDGTLWLNLGDSYWGGKGENGSSKARATAAERGFVQSGGTVQMSKRPQDGRHATLKPKDLVGIPWRVAFALQSDGWWLRQDIIWAKKNCMPESVRDRCTRAHEYIFMLSKAARYWYDAEAVKEAVCEVSLKRAEYGWDCDRPSTKNNALGNKPGIHTGKMGTRFVNPDGRNLRSVWTVTARPMPKEFGQEHFATFPPEIPERCIKAGCPAKVCAKCGKPWATISGRPCSECGELIPNQAKECPSCGYRNTEWRGQRKVNSAKRADDFSLPGNRVPLRQDLTAKSILGGYGPTCSCDAGTKSGTVLDPFFGAGTTGLVAMRLGREFIGIELNPNYCEMARKRIYGELMEATP